MHLGISLMLLLVHLVADCVLSGGDAGTRGGTGMAFCDLCACGWECVSGTSGGAGRGVGMKEGKGEKRRDRRANATNLCLLLLKPHGLRLGDVRTPR